jgi:hypothetical protein
MAQYHRRLSCSCKIITFVPEPILLAIQKLKRYKLSGNVQILAEAGGKTSYLQDPQTY